jgi:hypothetical protein
MTQLGKHRTTPEETASGLAEGRPFLWHLESPRRDEVLEVPVRGEVATRQQFMEVQPTWRYSNCTCNYGPFSLELKRHLSFSLAHQSLPFKVEPIYFVHVRSRFRGPTKVTRRRNDRSTFKITFFLLTRHQVAQARFVLL